MPGPALCGLPVQEVAELIAYTIEPPTDEYLC